MLIWSKLYSVADELWPIYIHTYIQTKETHKYMASSFNSGVYITYVIPYMHGGLGVGTIVRDPIFVTGLKGSCKRVVTWDVHYLNTRPLYLKF